MTGKDVYDLMCRRGLRVVDSKTGQLVVRQDRGQRVVGTVNDSAATIEAALRQLSRARPARS